MPSCHPTLLSSLYPRLLAGMLRCSGISFAEPPCLNSSPVVLPAALLCRNDLGRRIVGAVKGAEVVVVVEVGPATAMVLVASGCCCVAVVRALLLMPFAGSVPPTPTLCLEPLAPNALDMLEGGICSRACRLLSAYTPSWCHPVDRKGTGLGPSLRHGRNSRVNVCACMHEAGCGQALGDLMRRLCLRVQFNNSLMHARHGTYHAMSMRFSKTSGTQHCMQSIWVVLAFPRPQHWELDAKPASL